VAVLNGYLSLTALKESLRDTRTVDDDAYERAIEAASRRIDSHTGRQFWRTATAEPRLFQPVNRWWTPTGDFHDLTGVVVEVADTAGVFTPLLPTDWQPEPHVRINGYPYWGVVSTLVGGGFPVSGRRPRVRVTARWGWLAVPKPVEQACQLLATAYVKARDMTAGVTGFEGETARFDGLSPQAEALLTEFRVTRGVPVLSAPQPQGVPG
jgi:hypothetical protein